MPSGFCVSNAAAVTNQVPAGAQVPAVNGLAAGKAASAGAAKGQGLPGAAAEQAAPQPRGRKAAGRGGLLSMFQCCAAAPAAR